MLRYLSICPLFFTRAITNFKNQDPHFHQEELGVECLFRRPHDGVGAGNLGGVDGGFRNQHLHFPRRSDRGSQQNHQENQGGGHESGHRP